MKDEALALALEALEQIASAMPFPVGRKAITAIKQALALDKKAENARELGLDYEPSSVSKLAREAGIRDCTCNGTKGCLERFAELVRADEREQGQRWFDAVTAQHKQEILAEREACAKVCDDLALPPDVARSDASIWEVATLDCAEAIRARSNT